MALPKYNTAEHKALATRFAADIKAGRGWCVEPICVMTTRFIPPGTPRKGWHVPHNEDGITYRGGPAHARCNGAENARRNNPKRSNKRRNWNM